MIAPARSVSSTTVARLLALACAWLVLCLPVAAQELQFPALTGRVVDQANLLSAEKEAELTQRLEALERESSDQLVVVTVESLQDRDIADYGYQLGRAWGIGQGETDNGVLLIVAPNERKVRIAGTGEGFLLFERGETVRRLPEAEAVEELLAAARRLAGESPER